MRRADALVNILRGEIIAQHALGARVAVLAPHAVKQGAAALVEGFDNGGVFHRQPDLAAFQKLGFIGVEKHRFGIEIAAQRGIGIGHALLHRPVRENNVKEQRHGAVEQRAQQNHKRVYKPGHFGRVGERGIGGHGQRAESNGAVAQPHRAQQGKAESERRHRQHKRQPLAHRQLHAQRGDGKSAHGENDVFQTAGEAVVQIHQAAGDDAQHKRHG